MTDIQIIRAQMRNCSRYHRSWRRKICWLVALLIIDKSLAVPASARAGAVEWNGRVTVTIPASTRQEKLTGRIFLVLSRVSSPDPILQARAQGPVILGLGVNELRPGRAVRFDKNTLASPVNSVQDVPAGRYFLQAYATAFRKYIRADGHIIWALDQWDGQNGPRSAGVLYSRVEEVQFGGKRGRDIHLELTSVVPQSLEPADTPWVKHVKIQSKLLSEFWGRPIYLGADVLLPRDYQQESPRLYPVIYQPRNHYRRDSPFAFTTDPSVETAEEKAKREANGYETGYEFYRAWASDHFPRLVVVSLINPTPFYDFSSVMNSDNNGPYEDAVMTELIPFLETSFRIIRQPFARILLGQSSAGRDALGLQLHHPEFFGGDWTFYPWAFDYEKYFSLNIYKSTNAFHLDSSESPGVLSKNGLSFPERPFVRTLDGIPIVSTRQWMRNELVIGGHAGVGAEISGSDNALNGPIGPDGYPKPLFDRMTGTIDPNVGLYWRSHDLAAYTEDHWYYLAPLLKGKIHMFVGDMDEFYRNLGVRDFEARLNRLEPGGNVATFFYAPEKGHEYQPMTNAALIRQIATFIRSNMPKDADDSWLNQ